MNSHDQLGRNPRTHETSTGLSWLIEGREGPTPRWDFDQVRTLIALAAPLVPFGLFVLVPAVWSLPKPKSNAISL